MHDMPTFPIFMNVGDSNISIETNNELMLNVNEIEALKCFQSLVFDKILETSKNFMLFDPNGDNSFLVVPGKKLY